MSAHPLPAGLRLFYDLVHKLNSSLDLDLVLGQVIQQVNQFLSIDATSVSLLDFESHELVIQMTIGQATDPQPGLRLPPYAGIAGWVVRHGEPELVADVQKDNRFYPSVDQRTGFTTRSLICVPLYAQDRPVGVIQAMSRKAEAFSNSDLYFMVTLADVASLAIENARLYKAEHEARQQAEALKRIAETISSSLSIDRVLSVALEQLYQIVLYDSIIVFVLEEYSLEQDGCQMSGDTQFLSILATRGLGDSPDCIKTCIPVSQVALFQEMCAHKQPIALSDMQFGNRFANWIKPVLPRHWLGVPIIAAGRVIGQISIDRHTEAEFALHEIEIVTTFARQVAGAVVNAHLYHQARSRADELAILNDVAMAVSVSLDLDALVQRALDAIIALLDLEGGAILLWDESMKGLVPRASKGLAPDVLDEIQDPGRESIWDQVVSAQKTVVLGPDIEMPHDVPNKSERTLVLVPILAHSIVAGVVVIQKTGRIRSSTQQLSVLEAIGRQIGIALERAHLQDQLGKSPS